MRFSPNMCVFLRPLTSAHSEEKEPLYQQLCRAVIRLEHVELAQQDGKPVIKYTPDGTAFFVQSGDDLYVVSARHVVEKSHHLQSRVESKNRETGQPEVVLLELPRERWTFHSDQGDSDTRYVDVAVMKIPWIKDRSIKAFRYEPKDSKDHEKNQLRPEDPTPPDSILVFGFPADVGFQLLEQRPLARLGVVSMVTGKEFLKWENKFAEQRCCLIDARMFSGNSGSPVMNKQDITDPKPALFGLVIATNPGLDFGVMEPVSRIRETLDLARPTEKAGHWKIIPGKKAEQ